MQEQEQNQNQEPYRNPDLEQIYRLEPAKPKGKKGRKGLFIWLIILLCILAFAIVTGLAIKNLFSDSPSTAPPEPYVAVIYVEGVIAKGNVDTWGRAVDYQHDFTIGAIDNLINDSNNKGMILYVDSPGGGVYESDELYLKIKEYKEETGRPVYSYMASMAASGGYYISAPADMIFANRNCWTGSIGVTIGTLYDLSGFLEKYGVKAVTITAGRNKAMGSMVDPITDEQLRIFQSLVDEAYDQFVGIVSEGRNMDLDMVRELADGRIYTALQAKELGLIDQVATYRETLEHMAGAYDLEGYPIYEIRYQDNSFMGMLLNKLPLLQKPGGDADAVLSLLSQDVEFPISYLCEMLE